jgi:hypothetical protein
VAKINSEMKFVMTGNHDKSYIRAKETEGARQTLKKRKKKGW